MSVPVQPDVHTQYNLGPVKPWVAAAADFLGHMFNVKTIGGWRKSDPFPDHPTGHALDFMMGIPEGNALADYAVANYQTLGIKYIIHNRQVWNPKQGWHPYTSTSNPHTDHVHITFNDTPSAAFMSGAALGGVNGVTPVGLTNTAVTKDTCAWVVDTKLTGSTCVISKPAARGLVGGLEIATAIVFGVAACILLVYAAKDTSGGRAVDDSVGVLTSVVGLL